MKHAPSRGFRVVRTVLRATDRPANGQRLQFGIVGTVLDDEDRARANPRAGFLLANGSTMYEQTSATGIDLDGLDLWMGGIDVPAQRHCCGFAVWQGRRIGVDHGGGGDFNLGHRSTVGWGRCWGAGACLVAGGRAAASAQQQSERDGDEGRLLHWRVWVSIGVGSQAGQV